MKKAKSFLERYGVHSFLLPVFFILHSYKQYFGLIHVDVTMKALAELILFFLVAFLLLLIITKNLNKSLQLTTLFGFIYLFYGAIKDFFQLTMHVPFLSKYTVLLPLLIIIAIILARAVLKKKDFRKTNLFQNSLLLIFILVDAVMLVSVDNSYFLRQNLLTGNSRLSMDSLAEPPQKPDVYFLVFDSYPGTTFLKDYMQYDNSTFNDSLQNIGFRILADPKSNYNRSAFSIAATLNFEYLKNIKKFRRVSPKDYTKATLTAKHSLVPKIFNHYNYKFINLSIFDIGNVLSLHPDDFLTLPQKEILLYNTLSERLKRDLLWHFMTGKHAISLIQEIEKKRQARLTREQIKKRDFNNLVIDSLMKIPLQETKSPIFVYAHVYLPHPPFFYNENGSENELGTILKEESQVNKSLFLAYLKYSNNVALKIINQIMQASGGRALIILQSDHGFRDFEIVPSHPQAFFKNYSAFYFPDKDYSTLYDTMSNINTFPVIFNKYFGTNIPLQQDRTVFLAP
jgi:hypothetical protein